MNPLAHDDQNAAHRHSCDSCRRAWLLRVKGIAPGPSTSPACDQPGVHAPDCICQKLLRGEA